MKISALGNIVLVLARLKPAILLLAVFLLPLMLAGPAAAADAGRPAIVFFYVDELQAGESERNAIRQDMTGKFAQKYSPGYAVSFGEVYRREFTINRFTDLTSLDRFDLLPRLAADRVDYAVFYCVLPLQSVKDTLSPLAATKSLVHVRVYDLGKKAYVCDKVFSHTADWAWLSTHLAKLADDVDGQVFTALFPLKK
jgi:hypothetical protein